MVVTWWLVGFFAWWVHTLKKFYSSESKTVQVIRDYREMLVTQMVFKLYQYFSLFACHVCLR